jgi:hypothetical protein
MEIPKGPSNGYESDSEGERLEERQGEGIERHDRSDVSCTNYYEIFTL